MRCRRSLSLSSRRRKSPNLPGCKPVSRRHIARLFCLHLARQPVRNGARSDLVRVPGLCLELGLYSRHGPSIGRIAVPASAGARNPTVSVLGRVNFPNVGRLHPKPLSKSSRDSPTLCTLRVKVALEVEIQWCIEWVNLIPDKARCFPPFPSVLKPAQNSKGDQAGEGAVRVS